ncbi:MAG: hypothetical protein K2X93_27915 [Candidatus Obscuribacterales bacterium]|nr:hypothetical protein [Candidatus Obscuribacterales bacterium]
MNFIFALLAMFFTCEARGADTPPTPTSTYILEQTCGVLGDHTVVASSKSIKITDKLTGMITCAQAPDWKVLTIDPKNRVYSETPLDSFRSYIPDNEFVDPGNRWITLPFENNPPSKIAGQDVSVFKTPASFDEERQKAWTQESASMTFTRKAQYCVSQKIAVPPQEFRILCRFFELPEKGGIPLDFRYYSMAGHMSTWLFTSAINQTTNNEPFATVDPSFQKVATASDVRKSFRSKESQNKEKKKRPLL